MRGAPPDDAYGRVTNPERFGPVHDAADALVSRLLSAYQVECREPDEAASDGVIRQVELVPRLGAPLVIGSDACGEDPDDVIADLERTTGAVVAGRFTEGVVNDPGGTWRTFAIRHRHGGQSGRSRLREGDPRRREAGEIIWPARLHRSPGSPAGA